jgi:hypothetical protein
MRDALRDMQKVLVFFVAGLVLAVLWRVGVFVVGFAAGSLDFGVPELQAEKARTDTLYITQTDTVTKYQRRVDTVRAESGRLDSAVVIVNDSTLLLSRDDSAKSDTTVHVASIIVADIRALRLTVATQDTLIRSLYGRDSTQQWRIATRDKLYAASLRKANAPRWGYGVTLGYGCSTQGCGPSLSVGLTYQAPFPRLLTGIVSKAIK